MHDKQVERDRRGGQLCVGHNSAVPRCMSIGARTVLLAAIIFDPFESLLDRIDTEMLAVTDAVGGESGPDVAHTLTPHAVHAVYCISTPAFVPAPKAWQFE